jgi:hypothetical protein
MKIVILATFRSAETLSDVRNLAKTAISRVLPWINVAGVGRAQRLVRELPVQILDELLVVCRAGHDRDSRCQPPARTSSASTIR